jgi:hypothetical protein
MEYWETIEALGGYVWSTNHALSHGRIEDSDGEVAMSIVKAQGVLEGLVDELEGKFGVIHPKNCPKAESGKQSVPPSEGKTYYWDWYQRMKQESYKAEYDGMICSACPFTEGVEQMIALGGVVPCRVFSGTMYRLTRPYACGMLHSGGWSQETLDGRVIEAVGPDGLKKFRTKERELTERFVQTPQS